MNLFDFPPVKVDKKIRLIETFAGIGSQAMALRDLGADFEHHRVIEFDKYAVKSYNAIHGTDFKPTDIRDVHAADLGIVEKDKYTYLLTYSFPCTDLSVAGKMQGMSKADWESGKSTRSGLLWEVERILTECGDNLPDILLMENVPQVHAEKNIGGFNAWRDFLKRKGYWNFTEDLNATGYGIPQNRERCFMVSILSQDFIEYEFPKLMRLEKVMKDYLEESVEEKYYINNEKADKLIRQLLKDGVIGTENREQRTENREQRIMRTVDLCVKRPREITVANCIKARYDCGISNLQADGSGVVFLHGRQGVDNALTTVQKDNLVLESESRYRIRKLTPRECWRLMGYTDSDFDKAAAVVSQSQLYKQAGNAIVKQVLMGIFSQLHINGVKAWNDMENG